MVSTFYEKVAWMYEGWNMYILILATQRHMFNHFLILCHPLNSWDTERWLKVGLKVGLIVGKKNWTEARLNQDWTQEWRQSWHTELAHRTRTQNSHTELACCPIHSWLLTFWAEAVNAMAGAASASLPYPPTPSHLLHAPCIIQVIITTSLPFLRCVKRK